MSSDKYVELTDADTWAYIEAVNAAYPEDATDSDIQEQRRFYNAMCARFYAGRPDNIAVKDEQLDVGTHSIPLRHYRPTEASPAAHVVFYHGGGFVVGNLETHDDICAELCAGSGLMLTAVDYRLAPEHTHPAPFQDALAAFRSIAQGGLPVILMGDSAGGTLAAAVSHATRSEATQPTGQLLIYPALGGDPTQGSYVEHAHAPMLTAHDMEVYYHMLTGNQPHDPLPDDPTLIPLRDTDFSGLPRTLVITAQYDPLADDGPNYCTKITEAGGQADCIEESGLVHGYLRARHSVKRAKTSFERMITGLKRLATV